MRKSVLLLCGLLMAAVIAPLSSCGGSVSTGLSIVHFKQSILGDAQKDLSVSIGIAKGSDLKDPLDTALSAITTDQRTQLMTEALERSNSSTVVEGEGTVLTAAPHDDSKPDLIIGMEANYPPFNWTQNTATSYTYPIFDQTDQYADGYDVQIAKLMAESLNYNLIIKKMLWEALIPALQSGDINCIIAGMTDTAEREQSIDFTSTYYVSELVLVVKTGSDLDGITDLTALKGKKIISQISTVTDDVINDVLVPDYGAVHETALQTFADCAMAVQTGTADAMTAEYPVALSLVGGTD